MRLHLGKKEEVLYMWYKLVVTKITDGYSL